MTSPRPIVFLAALLAGAGASAFVPSCGRGEAQPLARPFRPPEPPSPPVVMNLPEPYVLRGDLPFLRLRRRYVIDSESAALKALGLEGIQAFDVDARGRVYVIQWTAARDHVFAFDNLGRFLRSFGPTGRDAGRIEFGGAVLAAPSGEVLAKDPSKSEVLVFDRGGRFLRRVPVPRLLDLQAAFANGYSLISWQDQTEERYINHVAVARRTFEVRRHLDSADSVNEWTAPEIPVGRYAFAWGASRDRIYVANAERGYEVRVFDLEGNLVRTIRKEYRPVPISAEYRREYLARIPERSPFKAKLRFAETWPPFRALFADDEGRLYVITHEEGPVAGERRIDVFDRDGLFVGRTSLRGLDLDCAVPVRIRAGVLHVLRAKPGGGKELAAYDMIWE